MILFRDEDDRYLAFLADPRNRDGFILNTLRQPSASYLALHRAACHSVQGHPANGRRWTTGVYCKLWSADAGELQEWAARELQGVPKPCGLCRPLHATEHDASVAESHPDQEEDVIPETKPEPGRTDIGGELVLELACEGGGETIFRRRTERGWVYWSAGSTMDFDANDDDYWRTWREEETANLGDLLSSSLVFLSLLKIHPEYRDWMREVYRSLRLMLEEDARISDGDGQTAEHFGRHVRKYWTRLLGDVVYPSFHSLCPPDPNSKVNSYQPLLCMDASSIPAMTVVRDIVRSSQTAESEVDAMLFSPDWQAHLVASVAIGLGAASGKTLAALWRAFDRGSFVSPQLAALASLVDDDFDAKARQRLTKGCPIPSNGDPKGLPALLALSLEGQGRSAWAGEFSTRFSVRLMLARDPDKGGRVATEWRAGFLAAKGSLTKGSLS